jgi:hypothetical protein
MAGLRASLLGEFRRGDPAYFLAAGCLSGSQAPFSRLLATAC